MVGVNMVVLDLLFPNSSEENMESPLPVLSHTVDGNYNSDGGSDKKLYTTEPDIDRDASIPSAPAVQPADYPTLF